MIIFMLVQVEPITQSTQTTRSQIAACGEFWVLKIEFEDWVCKSAWPIIIEQRHTWWKLNSLWQEAAVLECCCPLDLWPLWIWQACGVSEASVVIVYPWLGSRNSSANAWCTGGLRHSVCFSLHPSLPGNEGNKNNALWRLLSHLGWFSEFHLWRCERHSCSLWSLIRIQTDGIILLSHVFSPPSVIYLFALGCTAQGVGTGNTGQRKDHMLLDETP